MIRSFSMRACSLINCFMPRLSSTAIASISSLHRYRYLQSGGFGCRFIDANGLARTRSTGTRPTPPPQVPCGMPAYLEIDKLPDGRYRATVGTLFEYQEICRTRDLETLVRHADAMALCRSFDDVVRAFRAMRDAPCRVTPRIGFLSGEGEAREVPPPGGGVARRTYAAVAPYTPPPLLYSDLLYL